MSNDRFKFRVWDKRKKQYADRYVIGDDGWAYQLHDAGEDSYDLIPDEDVIIEQCTGLKDKNGTMIYEGDVIQENGINKYIYWNVTCWAYSMRKGHKNVAWELHEEDTENAEIIGNIHEVNHE